MAQDDGFNFLRIDHAAPFTDIKYWEIGNEEYGSWETNHHAVDPSTGAADPSAYASFAEQFAAMANNTILKNANLPQISIGIDSGDPTGASDGNWTKNVLADGLADKTDGLPAGFVPGFISDHSYMQGPGAESDSFLLDDTVTDGGSVFNWTTRYADYESDLQQTLGSRASSVQVMATEYNSVWSNPGKQTTSLVSGLFVAESLGSLLDSGYAGGCVWDLRNGWDTGENNSNLLYGWREGGDYGQLGDPNGNSPPTTGPYVAYPGYYALQLASKIIESGGEVVSATSNYSDLDVYAVMESSGDLELLVVNANPAASLTEQFDLTGFQPGGPAEVWQYGETEDTAQSQSVSGASALANASTSVSPSGNNFSYAFPAYSMTVLDLSPARLTSIVVQPTSGLGAGGTESFAATALDQSGNSLDIQPQFAWSLIGSGAISSTGVFTPPYAAGNATIQATSGSVTGSDVVALPGTAQWNGSPNTSWNTPNSWTGAASGSSAGSPGLRGVAGDGVVFNSAAGGSVDLNGASPSLADATFDSTGGYAIAQGSGGTLQLANGAGAATLTVAAGSDTISAPVALDSNLIAAAAAGSQLTISGGLSGAGESLTVNGPGTVVLSGASGYTGGTTVVGGTLAITSPAALPGSGLTTIGSGGRLVLGSGAGIGGSLGSGAGASALSSSLSIDAGSTLAPAVIDTAGDQPLSAHAATKALAARRPATPSRRRRLGPLRQARQCGLTNCPVFEADYAWFGSPIPLQTPSTEFSPGSANKDRPKGKLAVVPIISPPLTSCLRARCSRHALRKGLQRKRLMRLLLIPEGNAGEVVRSRSELADVLDLDFQRFLEAHGIGHVPAVHAVIAPLVLQNSRSRERKMSRRNPSRSRTRPPCRANARWSCRRGGRS